MNKTFKESNREGKRGGGGVAEVRKKNVIELVEQRKRGKRKRG